MALRLSDIDRQQIVQIAYHVADIDRAIARFHAATGLGPFFLRRYIPLVDVRYRGQPATLELAAAMVQSGDLQIEFIQQLCDSPSTFRDMFARDEEGLHHVAIAPREEAAMLAHYVSLGCPVATSFATAAGGGAHYVDTRAINGHMLEIYRLSDRIAKLYDDVESAAANWDGRGLIVEMAA